MLQAFAELGKRYYLDVTIGLSVNSIGHLENHKCNPNLNFKFDELLYQRVARQNDDGNKSAYTSKHSQFT